MAITIDDFSKIWASTSPLTPYEFSESQYKEGWNFIGSTPPSRQMWDFLQKNNDEKMQYLLNNFDNYLPLSGGTVTGDLTVTGTLDGTASGNLPLSGGTLTGDVDITGDLSVSGAITGSIQYVNNGKVFAIGNTTTGNVDLGWNWENRDGAGLGLRSTDYSNPGEFTLFARDSANSCSLDGNPNGTLKWDNKDVERVNASGSDYIRFESGLQICFGKTTDITSATTVTITFPVAFKAYNSYGVSIGRWWASSSTENYYLSDRTTTAIKLTTMGTVTTGSHFYYYVAVGYWK